MYVKCILIKIKTKIMKGGGKAEAGRGHGGASPAAAARPSRSEAGGCRSSPWFRVLRAAWRAWQVVLGLGTLKMFPRKVTVIASLLYKLFLRARGSAALCNEAETYSVVTTLPSAKRCFCESRERTVSRCWPRRRARHAEPRGRTLWPCPGGPRSAPGGGETSFTRLQGSPWRLEKLLVRERV